MARELYIQKTDNAVEGISAIHRWLNNQLHEIGNGRWDLRLVRHREKRSVSQNRLMWLWFNCIAAHWSEACGYTFTAEEVKNAFCMLFLPIDSPAGRIGGRTSTLTTEQMTAFLNNVQAHAATEYDIELPNPNDQRFKYFEEMYGGEQ